MIFNPMRIRYWLRANRIVRRRTSKNFGKAPIMFNVTAGGVESGDKSTHLYCTPKDFRQGKYRQLFAEELADLETQLRRLNAQFANLNVRATGPMLVEEFANKNKPALTLLAAIDLFLAQRPKRLAENTRRGDQTYSNCLKSYLLATGRRHLSILHVNNGFMADYEHYLREKHRKPNGSVGLKSSTVELYLAFIKQVLDFAQLKDHIPANPVTVYTVDTSDVVVDKTYLTRAELDRIHWHAYQSPEVADAARVLLLLTETGLSWCDYLRMSDSWLVRLGDMELPDDLTAKVDPAEVWLIDSRQKTRITFAIPLSELARQILEHYGGPDGLPHFRRNIDHFNKLLRSAAEAAGIGKYLTSRVLRKTFSHYWMNRSDVSRETVSWLMGHSQTSTTRKHYSDIHVETAIREVYARQTGPDKQRA